MSAEGPQNLPITRDHRRQWRHCLYVYPVISRRSGGLSVGVNLNPDKRCTFACVYCQINRRILRDLDRVDVAKVAEELELCLRAAAGGELWAEPRFADVPAKLRRIHDIAFSGDGEPTCLPQFDEVVRTAAEVKAGLGLDQVKLVVITNATQLDQPPLLRSLETLDACGGEIWAKLDAGTEAHFRQVNRPRPDLTLDKVVRDITRVARGRAIVIQSLFLKLRGAPPPDEEIAAYVDRLREITSAGGQIKLVQVHTIARPPADASAAALDDATLDRIADRIRRAVPDVPVETYYGADVPPQQDSCAPNRTHQ